MGGGPDFGGAVMTTLPAPVDRLAIERGRHGTMLALTAIAFVALLALEVRPEGKVGVMGAEGLELGKARVH